MEYNYEIEELDDPRTDFSNYSLQHSSYINKDIYIYDCLCCSSRWITKDGRKMKVPTEEPSRISGFLEACSEKDAVKELQKIYKNKILYDIKLS